MFKYIYFLEPSDRIEDKTAPLEPNSDINSRPVKAGKGSCIDDSVVNIDIVYEASNNQYWNKKTTRQTNPVYFVFQGLLKRCQRTSLQRAKA